MSLCSARTKFVITIIAIALIATMSLPASTYAASKAKVYKSGNYKVTVNYKDSKSVSVNVIGEAKSLSKSIVVPQKLKVKLKLKSAKKAKAYNLPIAAIKGIKLKSGSYIDLSKCSKLKTVGLASSETIRYKGYILKIGKAGEISVKGKYDERLATDYAPYEFWGRKVTLNALLPKDLPILGSGLYGWGSYNKYAQITPTPSKEIPTPTKISQIGDIKSIYSSGEHTLALKTDGTVWSWGYNHYDQLGDGTQTDHMKPAQISGLDNVVSIAAGSCSSFAVKSDGTVWGWGAGYGHGRFCDEFSQALVPTKINAISSVTSIATTGFTVAALKTDGTVWTWGSDLGYALGRYFDGSKHGADPTPGRADNMTNVSQISAGQGEFYAVKTDGTIWMWGFPKYNCLNFGIDRYDDERAYRVAKLTVTASDKVKKIQAGYRCLFLLKTDGTVWVSGYYNSGLLCADIKTKLDRMFGQYGSLTQLKQFKNVSDIFVGVWNAYAIVK